MNMQRLKRKLAAGMLLWPLAVALTGCHALAMGTKPVLTDAQRRPERIGLTLVVDAVEGAEMLGTEFFADQNEWAFYAKSRMVRRNREIMAFPGGVVPERVRVVWRRQDTGVPFWWGSPWAVDELGKSIPNYQPPLRDKKVTRFEFIQEKVAKRKLIAKNIGYVHQGPWGGDYSGEAVGDHTVAVASRIPDDVVREIRKNGGGLRLKFRLHPDGVLFGWDIERIEGGLPRHSMAGGDFREAGLAYELPGALVYKPYSDAAKPFLQQPQYFVPPGADTIWRKGWYIHPRTGQRSETDF